MANDSEKRSTTKPATPAKPTNSGNSIAVNVKWTPGETGNHAATDQEPTACSVLKEQIDLVMPTVASGSSIVAVVGLTGLIGGVGATIGAGAVIVGGGAYVAYKLNEKLEQREDSKLQKLIDHLYQNDPALMASVAKCAGHSKKMSADTIEQLVTLKNFTSNPLQELDANEDGLVTSDELKTRLKQYVNEKSLTTPDAPARTPLYAHRSDNKPTAHR